MGKEKRARPRMALPFSSGAAVRAFSRAKVTLLPTLNTREKLELAVVWTLVHLLGLPPRKMARPIGAWIGAAAFYVLPRLRSVGRQNLHLAYPEMSAGEQ